METTELVSMLDICKHFREKILIAFGNAHINTKKGKFTLGEATKENGLHLTSNSNDCPISTLKEILNNFFGKGIIIEADPDSGNGIIISIGDKLIKRYTDEIIKNGAKNGPNGAANNTDCVISESKKNFILEILNFASKITNSGMVDFSVQNKLDFFVLTVKESPRKNASVENLSRSLPMHLKGFGLSILSQDNGSFSIPYPRESDDLIPSNASDEFKQATYRNSVIEKLHKLLQGGIKEIKEIPERRNAKSFTVVVPKYAKNLLENEMKNEGFVFTIEGEIYFVFPYPVENIKPNIKTTVMKNKVKLPENQVAFFKNDRDELKKKFKEQEIKAEIRKGPHVCSGDYYVKEQIETIIQKRTLTIMFSNIEKMGIAFGVVKDHYINDTAVVTKDENDFCVIIRYNQVFIDSSLLPPVKKPRKTNNPKILPPVEKQGSDKPAGIIPPENNTLVSSKKDITNLSNAQLWNLLEERVLKGSHEKLAKNNIFQTQYVYGADGRITSTSILSFEDVMEILSKEP